MPSIYLESYPLNYSHNGAWGNIKDRDSVQERLFASQDYADFLQQHQISLDQSRPALWEKKGKLYFVFPEKSYGENWVEIPKESMHKNLYGWAYFTLRGYYPEENWQEKPLIPKLDFSKIPNPISLEAAASFGALRKKGDKAPVQAGSPKELGRYSLPSLTIHPSSFFKKKNTPSSPIVILGSFPNRDVNESDDEISESASFHEELPSRPNGRALYSLNSKEEESPSDYTPRSHRENFSEEEEFSESASFHEELPSRPNGRALYSLNSKEEESLSDYEEEYFSSSEEEPLAPIIILGSTPNISPRSKRSDEEGESPSQSPSSSNEEVESSFYGSFKSASRSSLDSDSIDSDNPSTPIESGKTTSGSSSPVYEDWLQESYENYNRSFLFLEENSLMTRRLSRSSSPLKIEVLDSEEEDSSSEDETSSNFLLMGPLGNDPLRQENAPPNTGISFFRARPQNNLPPSLKHLFPLLANPRSSPSHTPLTRRPPLLLTYPGSSSSPPFLTRPLGNRPPSLKSYQAQSPVGSFIFRSEPRAPLKQPSFRFTGVYYSGSLPLFFKKKPRLILSNPSASSPLTSSSPNMTSPLRDPFPFTLYKELKPPIIFSKAKQASHRKTYSSFAREMVYGNPFKKGYIYNPKRKKKPTGRLKEKEMALNAVKHVPKPLKCTIM